MQIIFNYLNQGWLGTLIGILGVLIAIYTYKRSMIGPRLVYQWSSLKIIGKNEVTPEEIEIYYKGIKVPRIIKTSIILWNSGNKTIDGSNIVSNNPLRLEFSENEKIIGASILKRTKEFNEVGIKINPNSENTLFIDFEYLDPEDGVCIEVLHTDIKRYPVVSGSVKGIPKGILYWGNKAKKREGSSIFATVLRNNINRFSKSNIVPWAVLITGLIISVTCLVLPLFFEETAKKIVEADNNSQISFFFTMFFVGITYISLSAYIIWNTRKRYPKILDPDKIESENNFDEKNE